MKTATTCWVALSQAIPAPCSCCAQLSVRTWHNSPAVSVVGMRAAVKCQAASTGCLDSTASFLAMETIQPKVSGRSIILLCICMCLFFFFFEYVRDAQRHWDAQEYRWVCLRIWVCGPVFVLSISLKFWNACCCSPVWLLYTVLQFKMCIWLQQMHTVHVKIVFPYEYICLCSVWSTVLVHQSA